MLLVCGVPLLGETFPAKAAPLPQSRWRAPGRLKLPCAGFGDLLPCHAHRCFAGICLRASSELAVEVGADGERRREAQIRASRDQGGIFRGAVPVTVKLAPEPDGAARNVAFIVGLVTQSWAQARRARNESGMPLLSGIIPSKRAPNSPRTSVVEAAPSSMRRRPRSDRSRCSSACGRLAPVPPRRASRRLSKSGRDSRLQAARRSSAR